MLQVLLVDDDVDFVQLVRLALQYEEVELEVAFSLEEGLRAVDPEKSGSQPDVILLDLTFADSPPMLTCLQLPSFTRIAPVIVMSSYKDDELPIALVEKGAQQFIHKGEVISEQERPNTNISSLRDKLMFELRAALTRHYRERPAEKILKKIRSIQWRLSNEWDR